MVELKESGAEKAYRLEDGSDALGESARAGRVLPTHGTPRLLADVQPCAKVTGPLAGPAACLTETAGVLLEQHVFGY